eukprot:GHVR01113210.1.p1 GENE.GHVR01113210.1~~GHVR01113210.1.p1  ORF type:complete len:159 (-),score=7.37 GHVR01113210.1:140-616(-)
MNESMTEVLFISSTQFKVQVPGITIGEHVVHVSEKARNIGVIFDSHASLIPHIETVCKKSFWNLKKISSLRPCLTHVIKTLVHAFITSNMDYCNSLYLGLQQSSLALLQRVQNTAARVITGAKRYDHITPVLRSLNWLPVQQRVVFKALVFVYRCEKV